MAILSEEWRDIPGYEGRYQVSDLGNVRSVWQTTRHGRPLKPFLSGPKRRQYPRVRLYSGTREHSDIFVHVIVMLAFDGPPPAGYEIDHLDNDPLNPEYTNLEYVTRPEQQRRVYRRDKSRLPVHRPGELNPCAVLTWDSVRQIRALSSGGHRNADLARRYGVDPSTISQIVRGRNWREVACQY